MIRFREPVNSIWFKAVVLLTLFIAAYWIPLRAMVNTWLNNADYSYGFLIPLLSIYLIWDMRSRLKGVEIRSSWALLPLLILLVLLSIYGILGSSGNISMPAIPLLIIGFTAFSFGTAITRRLIVPLGFLVFMVPIPPVLERTIGMYLKSISSKLGGAIIQLSNISVHVSGNVIDLGVTQLQVVDACSGLRYLFPLLALGIVYAYFFERVWWKRIFCVAATIPIAVLTNAFRIGITGILAEKIGPSIAEGFFHGFSGWVMFMVAFCVLFLIGLILRLFPPKGEGFGKTPAQQPIASPPEPVPFDLSRSRTTGAFVTSIALLLIVGGLSSSTKALPPITLQGGIKAFPLSFAEWSGRSRFIEPDIIDASGAEEAFSGFYQKSDGSQVDLYIGYRGTAFLANENFFHSPTVCLPASGWKEESISTHTIENVPGWGKLKVTQMVVDNMGVRNIVYFWFQTKSRTSHDKNINRFDLAMHAIKRDNTYDLFMRTITTLNQNEDIAAGKKRMDAFVRDMMPALFEFIKNNQEYTGAHGRRPGARDHTRGRWGGDRPGGKAAYRVCEGDHAGAG